MAEAGESELLRGCSVSRAAASCRRGFRATKHSGQRLPCVGVQGLGGTLAQRQPFSGCMHGFGCSGRGVQGFVRQSTPHSRPRWCSLGRWRMQPILQAAVPSTALVPC